MPRKLSWIGLAAILAIGWIAAASTSLSEDAFQKELIAKVIDPFVACLKDYNGAISALADQLNHSSEIGQPLEISPDSTKYITQFAEKLRIASKGAHKLTLKTSKAVVGLTKSISEIEEKMLNNRVEILQNEEKLKAQKEELQRAKAALEVAKKDLDASSDGLDEAEKDYKEAKSRCIIRRRRKRGLTDFLGSLVKGFLTATIVIPAKLVGKALVGVETVACHGINIFSGHIDSARRRKSRAGDSFQFASNVERLRQNTLENTTSYLAILHKQNQSLVEHSESLEAQLIVMKSKRDEMILVDRRMKDTTMFIHSANVRGDATLLTVVQGYILDKKNILEPLEEVGRILKKLSHGSNSKLIPQLRSKDMLMLISGINDTQVE